MQSTHEKNLEILAGAIVPYWPMIQFTGIEMPDKTRRDISVLPADPSASPALINASHLTYLPALIDPHVHFRTPGQEYKENWQSGAKAALAGGVTTVLDMPNNHPSCSTQKRLAAKKELIESQLQRIGIPLRYKLYLGADRHHLAEITKTRSEIAALKIYMGSSTGDLLIDDLSSLKQAFFLAAQNHVLVAVHAESEQLIQLNRKQLAHRSDASVHSEIRSAQAAIDAVEMAIECARQSGARLYIVHTSTKGELELIRKAKQEGLSVFAEAAPHHLFLDASAYGALQTKALVNPPLRSSENVAALWEAVKDGTIDTIGTDHAPHTLEEKAMPYGCAPSGFPSIELYLPLLLTAHKQGHLSLASIIRLTSERPREIFSLEPNDDFVLVDLEHYRTVDDAKLYTRAKWSPYHNLQLTGWPRYTILKGKAYVV